MKTLHRIGGFGKIQQRFGAPGWMQKPKDKTAAQKSADRMMVAVLVFLSLIVGCMLLTGCGLNTQVVKMPVPVPCVDTPVQLSSLPLEGLTPAEAHDLGAHGLWGDLADRVAATLHLLAADRLAQAAQLDNCAKIPAASPATATHH